MTGWECYDTTDDWWIGIAWGDGGHDVPHDHLIPLTAIAPYFT